MTVTNALGWLIVCVLSPIWIPLMTVAALWHLACSAADYIRWRWRFGDCVTCNSPYCPKTGPWFARRRLHAECPGCAPELYPKPNTSTPA